MSSPQVRRPVRQVLALTFAALLALSVGAVSPPSVAAANTTTRTVTLSPDRATHTSLSDPAKNFSGDPNGYASVSAYSTYLGFPSVRLAPGESVTGVSLKAYVSYVHGRGKTNFAVIPVVNSWSANKVTHKTQPVALGAAVNVDTSAKVGTTTAFKLDAKRTASTVQSGASFRVMNRESNSAATVPVAGSKAPQLVVQIVSAAGSSSQPVPPAAGGKRVFAHYFPPYPLSIDNKAPAEDYYARNYLVASGEKGKYQDVGGLLRDRPIPRNPLSGNWKLEDLKTEVRQAVAAGVDGFAVDILNLEGSNWDRTVMLMQAASEVSPSFKIMLQPDTTASAGKASAAALAASLAKLASYPSVHKLPDGRVVISPFKAENKTPAQWSEVLTLMKTQHGVDTAFLPLFLDADKMSQYASISIGFGNWGTRDPMLTAKGPNYAAKAHALGKLWMQPVSIQDARPNQKLYDEAGNTEMLRTSWDTAITQGADMVLLVTWNDYSEGSHFAPSVDHGHTFLDISKRYSQHFKTGRAPAIDSDVIHITQRIHGHAARPAYPNIMLQWSGTRTKPRDTVEVLTVLKSSATVKVIVGSSMYSYTAPAGVSAKLFPLEDGYSTAIASRTGKAVAAVRTKDAVSAKVTQQDMTYHAVSSGP